MILVLDDGSPFLVDGGLLELRRVLKPRGIVLVKCQNYVSSGHLWTGAKRTLDYAERIGFEVVDWWTHVGHVRAQPTGRRIVHARQNASTLFVLRSPK